MEISKQGIQIVHFQYFYVNDRRNRVSKIETVS